MLVYRIFTPNLYIIFQEKKVMELTHIEDISLLLCLISIEYIICELNAK